VKESGVPVMQQDGIDFPTVEFVEGGMSSDGEAVLLQLWSAGQPIHFSLRAADLEPFVTFILQMAASTPVPSLTQDRSQYQPIPLSALSAGELEDGSCGLGVTIGGTELMFQIPAKVLSEVGQTLMLVGAADESRPLT
jgi:hypothetical protein